MTADELAAMEAKAIAVCDADGSGCVTWAEVDQCEHDHVSCFTYLWYLIKVSTKFREVTYSLLILEVTSVPHLGGLTLTLNVHF